MAKQRTAIFLVYKDKLGEYRWRLVSANSRVVADSGEGYSSPSKCRIAVRRMFFHVQTAEVS